MAQGTINHRFSDWCTQRKVLYTCNMYTYTR